MDLLVRRVREVAMLIAFGTFMYLVYKEVILIIAFVPAIILIVLFQSYAEDYRVKGGEK